jgi:hypothetical protein
MKLVYKITLMVVYILLCLPVISESKFIAPKKPDSMPEFVIQGNPIDYDITRIEINGTDILDIGWKHSGIKPEDPNFKYPINISPDKRIWHFYSIKFINQSKYNIRFIEGESTAGTYVDPKNAHLYREKNTIIKRNDVIRDIQKYDITSEETKIRIDYFIYGPEDGSEPYSETTYRYYIQETKEWFAIKIIRDGKAEIK